MFATKVFDCVKPVILPTGTTLPLTEDQYEPLERAVREYISSKRELNDLVSGAGDTDSHKKSIVYQWRTPNFHHERGIVLVVLTSADYRNLRNVTYNTVVVIYDDQEDLMTTSRLALSTFSDWVCYARTNGLVDVFMLRAQCPQIYKNPLECDMEYFHRVTPVIKRLIPEVLKIRAVEQGPRTVVEVTLRSSTYAKFLVSRFKVAVLVIGTTI